MTKNPGVKFSSMDESSDLDNPFNECEINTIISIHHKNLQALKGHLQFPSVKDPLQGECKELLSYYKETEAKILEERKAIETEFMQLCEEEDKINSEIEHYLKYDTEKITTVKEARNISRNRYKEQVTWVKERESALKKILGIEATINVESNEIDILLTHNGKNNLVTLIMDGNQIKDFDVSSCLTEVQANELKKELENYKDDTQFTIYKIREAILKNGAQSIQQ